MKHLKWGMLIFVLATLLATGISTLLVAQRSRAASPNCGSWSVVASPDDGTNSNYLYSVAAVSPTDVWAAGYYVNTDHSTNRTLTEHWNGTNWKVVVSFNYLTGANVLYGIEAASSSNIWAVGYFTNGNNVQRPLSEQWNGTKWKFVKNPGIGTGTNILYGVAASSAKKLWAVGTYVNQSGMNQTLIEQWSGTSWSVVASPNVAGSTSDVLTSVTASSPSNAWAVGSYTNSSGITQTLIEQWNGTSWSIISSPNAGSGNNVLTSVASSTSKNAWAVGNYTNSSGVNQTLTEQWNGTSWSIVASPDVGTTNNFLNSVAITSSTDAWAAGDYTNSSGVNQTLTEQWNGTSWSIVASPNVGTGSNAFLGVAVTSASGVWAVGDYNNSTVDQTLTEFYC
jgi:hypothetical protein